MHFGEAPEADAVWRWAAEKHTSPRGGWGAGPGSVVGTAPCHLTASTQLLVHPGISRPMHLSSTSLMTGPGDMVATQTHGPPYPTPYASVTRPRRGDGQQTGLHTEHWEVPIPAGRKQHPGPAGPASAWGHSHDTRRIQRRWGKAAWSGDSVLGTALHTLVVRDPLRVIVLDIKTEKNSNSSTHSYSQWRDDVITHHAASGIFHCILP